MGVKIGCVVLASGFGRRFAGGNKLLAPVEGVPLAQRTLKLLAPLPFARRVVVSQWPQVRALAVRAGFEALDNPQSAEGIAASVRMGTAAMEGLDGALFAVCDQPFLTTASIQRLIDTFSESNNSICALSFQGQRGNPAVFPAAFFPALSALKGDRGGGQIIRAHPEALVLVECASAWELMDIDRAEDLRRRIEP